MNEESVPNSTVPQDGDEEPIVYAVGKTDAGWSFSRRGVSDRSRRRGGRCHGWVTGWLREAEGAPADGDRSAGANRHADVGQHADSTADSHACPHRYGNAHTHDARGHPRARPHPRPLKLPRRRRLRPQPRRPSPSRAPVSSAT